MAAPTAAGSGGARKRARGFALVMVLVAVVVLGLATLVPLRNEQQAMQRERESELLFIGNQFRQAIASYAAATPAGAAPYPKTLDDLLEDKRAPNVRRHLRRIYTDPMTSAADWALLKEQGAIVGVASSSTRTPLKHSGFALADRSFADASTYADWKFLSQQPAGNAAPALDAPAPAASAPASPQPATPSTNPSVDQRSECLRTYSASLNVCGREPATAIECRAQARGSYLACLHG